MSRLRYAARLDVRLEDAAYLLCEPGMTRAARLRTAPAPAEHLNPPAQPLMDKQVRFLLHRLVPTCLAVTRHGRGLAGTTRRRKTPFPAQLHKTPGTSLAIIILVKA